MTQWEEQEAGNSSNSSIEPTWWQMKRRGRTPRGEYENMSTSASRVQYVEKTRGRQREKVTQPRQRWWSTRIRSRSNWRQREETASCGEFMRRWMKTGCGTTRRTESGDTAAGNMGRSLG